MFSAHPSQGFWGVGVPRMDLAGVGQWQDPGEMPVRRVLGRYGGDYGAIGVL